MTVIYFLFGAQRKEYCTRQSWQFSEKNLINFDSIWLIDVRTFDVLHFEAGLLCRQQLAAAAVAAAAVVAVAAVSCSRDGEDADGRGRHRRPLGSHHFKAIFFGKKRNQMKMEALVQNSVLWMILITGTEILPFYIQIPNFFNQTLLASIPMSDSSSSSSSSHSLPSSSSPLFEIPPGIGKLLQSHAFFLSRPPVEWRRRRRERRKYHQNGKSAACAVQEAIEMRPRDSTDNFPQGRARQGSLLLLFARGTYTSTTTRNTCLLLSWCGC